MPNQIVVHLKEAHKAVSRILSTLAGIPKAKKDLIDAGNSLSQLLVEAVASHIKGDLKGTLEESDIQLNRWMCSILRLSQDKDNSLDPLQNNRYGPIFPCICCHQLNWKYKMRKVDDIFGEQVHHVDIDYVVNKHNRLFRKLDAYWICDGCNGETRSGKRPRMSSMNGLQCPWEDVPERLLALNEVGIQEDQSNIRN